MDNQFVTYEIALALKELGFNENCFTCYNPGKNLVNWYSEPNPEWPYCINSYYKRGLISEYVAAPLWQQVMDWFRVTHNMLVSVCSNDSGYLFEWSDTVGGTYIYDFGFDGTNDSGCWNTFEEARKASIIYALLFINGKIDFYSGSE